MGVAGGETEGGGQGLRVQGIGRVGLGKWGGGVGPPATDGALEEDAAELGGAPDALARAFLLTNSSGNLPLCFGEARRQDGQTSVKHE